MLNSITEIGEQGHVNVEYPENLRTAVETAVDSWKEFCHLSKAEKCAFNFIEDNHGDGAGYELKEEKGSKKDLKENFHVTLYQYPRLEAIANNRTFAFLNDAKILLDEMEPLILDFAQGLEAEYSVKGLVEEVKLSKPYWILRYLHYFGNQQAGAEIAAPHTDRRLYATSI